MKALLLTLLFQCPDGSPPPCVPARNPRRTAELSVAVLYFDNRSRDSADAYLAEGLTEQTIAQLGEIERLTVSSRFAVRRFRGTAMSDPATVGRRLNAAYLVTGSVQRSGNRLRVGVELVRAASGVRVWGEQYDRTETDLLRLQDDIASSVATGIVGRLLPAERRDLVARATRNPEAYDRFLRGNFHLARRDAGSLLVAIREYQAAIAADPSFTDAIARVGYVYALALDNENDIGLTRDTLVARGVAMAERAVRLDSNSSDAWLAAAYMRMAQYPQTFEGVRTRFERAIALNPRSAEAHHQFASFLSYMGDTTAALAENRRALELEPDRAITYHQLASLAMQMGRPEESMRWSDSGTAADFEFMPGRVLTFYSALSIQDTARALRAIREMHASADMRGAAVFFEIVLAAARGDTVAANGLRATPALVPGPTTPGTVMFSGFGSMALALLGYRDAAIRLLEAAQPRGLRLHDLMRYSPYDPIRNDPAFQRLWNQTRAPGMSW